MASIIDTTNLFSRCAPARSLDIDKCGALTACNVVQTTADEIATIWGSAEATYRISGKILQSDMVARQIGARTNGFYDFMQANSVTIGKENLSFRGAGAGQFAIAPFANIERRRTVNNEYWTVRVDAPTAGYNQTDNIVLRFYPQGSVPVHVDYFPAGLRVHVRGVNTAAGDPAAGDTTYTLSFVVVSADATGTDGDGNFVTLTVTPQNAESVWADKGTAALQAKSLVPTDLADNAVLGLGVRGTVNVHPQEYFCSEIPAINPTQMIQAWMEYTRWTLCKDELVQKYLDLLLDGNPAYKKFAHVPDVERERQVVEDFQRRVAWQTIFGKPYANQNSTAWESLSNIVIPADSVLAHVMEGRCVGKRASMVGFYEQFAECDRILDLEGEDLDLRQFINSMYYIQENREAAGINSDIIEVYGNSWYLERLAIAMVNKIASDTTDKFRITADINGGRAEQGPFGFRFRRFNISHPMVEIRLVTHRFFDHFMSAMTTANSAFKHGGNWLWVPDWTAIKKIVGDAMVVENTTGNIQQLAAVSPENLCVMDMPQRTVQMHSMMQGIAVTDETTSQFYEGLGDDITVGAELTDASYFTS